jgi:hypothetical protein
MGFSKFLLIGGFCQNWLANVKSIWTITSTLFVTKLGITAPLTDNTKNDFKDCSITSVFAVHLKCFGIFTFTQLYTYVLKYYYNNAIIGLNFNKGSPLRVILAFILKLFIQNIL